MEEMPPALPSTPRKPTDPFTEQFQPVENARLFGVIDATLKRPARLVYELIHGEDWKPAATLFVILLFCRLA